MAYTHAQPFSMQNAKNAQCAVAKKKWKKIRKTHTKNAKVQ